MKLDFEYWVEDNACKETTKVLLNEAIVCYKNSAYRGALLLSYIAFIDIIRYRLFEAKTPPEISENEWGNNHTILENDDKYEKQVFDLLMRKDGKYFKTSDSLRTQIEYWKDRRNDCAHFKDNCIDASHIENFWLFLRSNLNKINVVGGQADLLNRIKRHFDETYTPYETDFHYLVKEIPSAIDICDYRGFLDELYDFFEKLVENNWFYICEDTRFFYDILNSLEGRYYDIIKSDIYNNEKLSSEMLQVTPQFLKHYTKDNPEFVRKVWRDNLSKANCSKVGCELLRNSIIPINEIKEFVELLVELNHNGIPSEEEITFLTSYGYIEKINKVIETTLKDTNSYKWWVDKNEKFIEFYIKYIFKYKKKDVVLMIIEGHKESKNTQGLVYKIFTDAVEKDETNKALAQECCDEIGYKLDDITWIYLF